MLTAEFLKSASFSWNGTGPAWPLSPRLTRAAGARKMALQGVASDNSKQEKGFPVALTLAGKACAFEMV
jgi:hypothetical protein